MKLIVVITLLFLSISCVKKDKQKSASNSEKKLILSEFIDDKKPFNKELILALEGFLKTKNESLYDNEYWEETDFNKYIFPYNDIYRIEVKDSIQDYFEPVLMQIINTEINDKKLLKVAFSSENQNKKTIKSIYNILAEKKENKIYFKRPLEHFTAEWRKKKIGSINYIITPRKAFNKEEADEQLSIIEKLCGFFKTTPIEIKYYSCKNPKEIFEIKGFDYNPLMYISKTGGLAESNIVFSGNNSEFYAHEVTHIYLNNKYQNASTLLGEGFATLVGGSGKNNYSWHRNVFKEYLKDNPSFDLTKHLEPYEGDYINDETPIPYIIGALICERTLRKYGKEKLLETFSNTDNIWNIMQDVGLTKENFNSELRLEIKNYAQQHL